MSDPQVDRMTVIAHGDPVKIACCPEHGLHGERSECFVCGGPVEQVEYVPANQLRGAVSALTDVRAYAESLKRSPERHAQRIGADLMGLLASHEWGQ